MAIVNLPAIQEEATPSAPVDNMALWKQLAATDRKYTKPFRKSGGFSGTDINPTWRFRRMTETFGPVGVGWGWDVHDRWSEEVDGKKYAFISASVWYRPNLLDPLSPSAQTGIQIGGTEFGRSPDEAYKMAVTDAIGKCMVTIGLAADVYLGEFDTKYSRGEEPVWKAEQLAVIKTDLATLCKTIDDVDNYARKVALMAPPAAVRPQIQELFTNRRKELAV